VVTSTAAPTRPRNFVRYALSAISSAPRAGRSWRAHEFLSFVRPGAMPGAGQRTRSRVADRARLLKKQVLASRVSVLIDPFSPTQQPVTDGVWSLPYVYLYALQSISTSPPTPTLPAHGKCRYRLADNFNCPIRGNVGVGGEVEIDLQRVQIQYGATHAVGDGL